MLRVNSAKVARFQYFLIVKITLPNLQASRYSIGTKAPRVNAKTEALSKSATDQRELTSTFENTLNGRVIFPTHHCKFDNFVR